MAKNNEGTGPIQPKSGDWLKAIDRGAGYDATVGAMGSKTRSQYPHVDKDYCYTDTTFDGTMIAERGHQNP